MIKRDMADWLSEKEKNECHESVIDLDVFFTKLCNTT